MSETFKVYFLAELVWISSLAPVRAADLCDDNNMQSFMEQAGRLSHEFEAKTDSKRWARFEQLIKDTQKCMNGAYSEGISAVAESALSHDWEGFTKFVASRNSNSQIIEQIVQCGVSDMTSDEDLARIKASALSKCPASLTDDCKRIIAFQPASGEETKSEVHP